MLYEFCFLKLPFKAKSEGLQLYSIFEKLGSPPDDLIQQFSKNCNYKVSFWESFSGFALDQYFHDEIDQRDHTKNLSDVLNKCWCYDQKNRVSASDLLNHPFFKD